MERQKKENRTMFYVNPTEQEKCISEAFYITNEIYLYSNHRIHNAQCTSTCLLIHMHPNIEIVSFILFTYKHSLTLTHLIFAVSFFFCLLFFLSDEFFSVFCVA